MINKAINVFLYSPQLVRSISNSDKEDEEPVASSRLLGELQRLNTSYNPDAKSELDRLDGLTPKNSNTVEISQIEVASLAREASIYGCSKQKEPKDTYLCSL